MIVLSNTEHPVEFKKECVHCGQVTTFVINKTDFNRWKVNGEYIQNVFPNLDVDTREMAISGTHPKCWNEMFGDE